MITSRTLDDLRAAPALATLPALCSTIDAFVSALDLEHPALASRDFAAHQKWSTSAHEKWSWRGSAIGEVIVGTGVPGPRPTSGDGGAASSGSIRAAAWSTLVRSEASS